MLVPGFESFVGLYPIPMRHGMTIGELARLFNEHFGIGADLDVVTMDGWHRACITTRPAHPGSCRRRTCRRSTPRSSIPGTVLFEGTNVSEGAARRSRSSSSAPRGRRGAFADGINRRGLPGVFFRPALFEPTFHKHAKDVRRLPDPRHRSRDVSRRCSPARSLTKPSARPPGPSGGGLRRTSTRTTSCRSTSWREPQSRGSRSEAACRHKTSRDRGEPRGGTFNAVRREISALLIKSEHATKTQRTRRAFCFASFASFVLIQRCK